MAPIKAHTIILSQSTSAQGICEMFERELKEKWPDKRELTYDIKDLHLFIDRLADLSALVYDNSAKAYIPCNRDWIKKKCFQHLHKSSGKEH